MLDKNARIYVAGHRGLVGGAILRALQGRGYSNIETASSAEVDLRNQQATRAYLQRTRPQYVYLAAAKVGGILANAEYPAEFLYDNLMIQANVINGAFEVGVKKLLFLGSTCIYPKLASQPLKEQYLLTGPLEPTNEAYAIAKIAGIKLCEAFRAQYGCSFISAMPTNLYGPGDNFDLRTSHVLPALVRKFHEAKSSAAQSVEIWGSGTPRREFCHVDDVANACLHLMDEHDSAEIVNIGVGEDISILELAKLIARTVGFDGELQFDSTKPDGTPRKLVDVTRLFSMGWRPKISLEDGLAQTYDWFRTHCAET